ncbi:extracellular solute-binding protein, partial [Patescibacteria group bacterium]|nr:extracellular solute-binding protein [Patescibacteria group bacterium]
RDDKGQIKIAGIAMGGTGNIDHWPDILGLMFLQNGTQLPRLQGKLAQDAVKFYTAVLRSYKAWDPLLSNSTREFAGGRLAMYFGFSWDVFEIQHLNPDLKFKIVPVPQIKPRLDAPERLPVAWASYWVEGVSVRSDVQAETWSLLEYLSTPEVMRQLYENQIKIGGRAFGEPYSRREMAKELAPDPLVSPFLAQAEIAQSWYLCSRTFDNGLNEGVIDYFEDVVNEVNEGGDVEEELETASEGIEVVLNRYGIR